MTRLGRSVGFGLGLALSVALVLVARPGGGRGAARGRRRQGVHHEGERRAQASAGAGVDGGLDQEHVHHRRHRADGRRRNEGLLGALARAVKEAARFATAHRRRHQAHADCSCGRLAGRRPRRSEAAPRADHPGREAGGDLRQSQVLLRQAGDLPRHRSPGRPVRQEPRTRPSCRAAWLGWHAAARDQPRPLHALRRAREHRARARSAFPTWASCGAPPTTCRRPRSRPRSSGSGSR